MMSMTGEPARSNADEALRPPPQATGDVGAPWLLCRTGSHHFALPISDVIETMRMLPIESLAGAPSMVCGLSIVRGVPTPVVDPALLFGGEPGRRERLVTVRVGARIVALAAQAVVGIWTVREEELAALPPLLSEVGAVAALKPLDRDLVFFLRAARVVPDEVLDRCPVEGAAT
jgi:purine-binding chemotaxis protein CheW